MLITTFRSLPLWSIFWRQLASQAKTLDIEHRMTFFPEVLLLMGGLDKVLLAHSTKFDPDATQQWIKLNVMLTAEELTSFAENFAEKFPRLELDIDGDAQPGTPTPIICMFRLDQVIAQILPVIPQLQRSHPTFIQRHQDSIYKVFRALNEMLLRYSITPTNCDVVEETICQMAQRELLAKYLIYRGVINHFHRQLKLASDMIISILEFCGLPALDIVRDPVVTHTSLYEPNETGATHILMALSISIKHAQALQFYLNDMLPTSTTVREKQEYIVSKKATLTVLDVHKDIFFLPKFQKKFEATLFADFDNRLDFYRHVSQTANSQAIGALTAEKLEHLTATKQTLLARTRFFNERFHETMTPLLNELNSPGLSSVEKQPESPPPKRMKV